MPLRSVKMKRFIFGFQRRVWCPKCTPESSSCFMVTTAMAGAHLDVSGVTGSAATLMRLSRRAGSDRRPGARPATGPRFDHRSQQGPPDAEAPGRGERWRAKSTRTRAAPAVYDLLHGRL